MKNDANQGPFISQEWVDKHYAKWNLHYAKDRKECDNGLAFHANQEAKKLISATNVNPWEHSFDKEGRWHSEEHCELSLLSKNLFYRLFAVMQELHPIEKLHLNEDFGYRTKSGVEYGKDFLFHFDVMNNPKPGGNEWRLGNMAKESPISFADIYHTIGNFAPIPWWIERTYQGTHSCNLQGFHNGLAEWWDSLLLYLQWRMPEFAKSKMSFADYIILTCQFFYVDNHSEDKDIFDQLYTGELDAKSFCIKVDERGGWRECARRWSEDLRTRKDGLQVISLMRRNSSKVSFLHIPEALRGIDPEKRSGSKFQKDYWNPDGIALPKYDDIDEDRIDETIKRIRRLIEVRGRCIIGLLKE